MLPMLASLQRVLSPFFTHVQRLLFVELQRLTGLLISGSAVIAFFTEVSYPDSDLDLFVDFDRRIPVFDFLIEAGWRYIPRAGQAHNLQLIIDNRDHDCTHTPSISFSAPGDYPGHAVVTVLNFMRPNYNRRIQVILTRGLPLYCILQFHSTCVMNFISDAYAVSLYPLATFVHKKSASSHLMARIPTPNTIIAKYTARGFKYIQPGTQYDRMFEPFRCRRVGDKYCWTIKLNNFDDHEDCYSPLLANTWRLIDSKSRGGFWMDCGVMRGAFLEESYCVSSSLLSSVCPNNSLWSDEHMYDTIVGLV